MIILTQPELRLSVADGSDSIGHVSLHLRASASAAQALAALAQLRTLLPTDCAPRYGRVRYTALEAAPAPGAGDATRCAVFVFETTAPGQLAVIALPGLRPDMVDPAAPHLVKLTAPPVQALLADLKTGIWCNPFGYSLTNCIAALVETQP